MSVPYFEPKPRNLLIKAYSMISFKANGLPLLVGSLPMDDHPKAARLVMDYTPEIPLWVQLPQFREEGMINQFLPGLPGLTVQEGKHFLDTKKTEFDEEFLAFFEEYLALSEPGSDLEGSRFAFSNETGKGFFEFLNQVDSKKGSFVALKGQVTGPITFGTGVKDEADRDIFYNDQLRDAAVKKLALNARWQANAMAKRGAVPIIFLDEPALAGFGTSAYITISKDAVIECIEEIVREIHGEKGLAGVHVCANTEWDMLLGSNIDVISFDAFSFFDKFILYPEMIKAFLNKGGILAFGFVPTGNAELIAQQTTQGLVKKFEAQVAQLTALGFDRETIIEQVFITPSCGTGSLDFESAKRVLQLTKQVSAVIREK
jgi:methionine synthase II (cobalamin-independent)